jgi:hypothetical protein
MRPQLPPATAAANDPLFGVLVERAAADSRPRERTDPHVVALAVRPPRDAVLGPVPELLPRKPTLSPGAPVPAFRM